MNDRRKTIYRFASHALSGRIGSNQIRMPGLEVGKLPHQLIVFIVRYSRIRLDIIQIIVSTYLFPKVFN